ncbi:hypothetical protein CDAR_94111 [Caerostris darwini]|uniref:Uncharacterized protein n=1 Tax=Caerostris darwini TaxID=1538125 RepID=A0AAV4NMW7_9ARAC|nr:hypothetical protein CDAR_94111 [Caerostris darwini]
MGACATLRCQRVSVCVAVSEISRQNTVSRAILEREVRLISSVFTFRIRCRPISINTDLGSAAQVAESDNTSRLKSSIYQDGFPPPFSSGSPNKRLSGLSLTLTQNSRSNFPLRQVANRTLAPSLSQALLRKIPSPHIHLRH